MDTDTIVALLKRGAVFNAFTGEISIPTTDELKTSEVSEGTVSNVSSEKLKSLLKVKERPETPKPDDIKNSCVKLLETQVKDSVGSEAQLDEADSVVGIAPIGRKSWAKAVGNDETCQVSYPTRLPVTLDILFGNPPDFTPAQRVINAILKNECFWDGKKIVPNDNVSILSKDIREICCQIGFPISHVFTIIQKNNTILSERGIFLHYNRSDGSIDVRISKNQKDDRKEEISRKNVKNLAAEIFRSITFYGFFNEQFFFQDCKDFWKSDNFAPKIASSCGKIMGAITGELVKQNKVMENLIKDLINQLNELFNQLLIFNIEVGKFNGKDCLVIIVSVKKCDWGNLLITKANINTNALYYIP